MMHIYFSSQFSKFSTLGVSLLLIFFLSITSTKAQIVTNTLNSGAGSLPDVIAAAAPGSTVTFNFGLDGLNINNIQVTINKDLTIDASSLPNSVTIVGNGVGSVFKVTAGNTVDFINLKLSNPNIDSPSLIGGIDNDGTLNIYDCYLFDIGSAGANGLAQVGGIYNSGTGTLNIYNSTFDNIKSDDVTGAILNDGNLYVLNSTIYNIDTDGGCTCSPIIENTATGTATLEHTTIYLGTSYAVSNSNTGTPVTLNFCLLDETFDVVGESLLLPAATVGRFSGNYNVFGDDRGGLLYTIAGVGNVQVPSIPAGQIQALADNGGRVPTCEITAGNPAINVATTSSFTSDARGSVRVGAPDAGAFEFGAPTPRVAIGGDWSDVSSWVNGIKPTANDDVIIDGTITMNEVPPNLTNVFIATGNTLDMDGNDLTVVNIETEAPTGTLSMATGTPTLTVTGDYIQDGNFLGNNGTVVMTGNPGIIDGSAVPDILFDNLTIDVGAIIAQQADIRVNGNFLSDATLNMSGFNAIYNGDFTNNDTYNASTGNVTFSSTNSIQTIDGIATTTFSNLIVNNTNTDPNDKLIINGNTTVVSTNLTFTAGDIQPNLGDFTMSEGITLTSPSNGSHIDGKVRVNFGAPGTELFPTGNGAVYAPAEITSSGPGSVNVGYFTGSTTLGASFDASIDAISQLEYWDITTSGGENLNIRLYWDDLNRESNIDAFGDIRVASNNGVSWSANPSTSSGTNALGNAINLTAVATQTTSNAQSQYTFGNAIGGGNDFIPVNTFTNVSGTGWNTAVNWSLGVPVAGQNLIIAGNADVDVTPAAAENLTINGGFTLDLQGFDITVNGDLLINGVLDASIGSIESPVITVGGDYTQNGAYTSGDAKVVLTGTSTIGGSALPDILFDNLEISGVTTLAADIGVNGKIKINSGNTLDVSASNFTISLGGDWDNDSGTFVRRNGEVIFNGSFGQIIGSFITETFYDLTINLTGGAIDILTNSTTVQVENQLDLQNGGILSDGIYPVVLLSGATIANGGSTSFVAGTLEKVGNTGNFTFHVGSVNAYAPITVTNITGSSGTDRLRVQFYDNGTPNSGVLGTGLEKVHPEAYWTINRTGDLTGQVRLEYDNATWQDFFITDQTNLRVAGENGSDWNDLDATPITTGDITVGTIETNEPGGIDFSTTSFFTFGNATGGTNPFTDLTTFITTWETTASFETITIPTTGGGYSFTIDWGDGTVESLSDMGLPFDHTYVSSGVYEVSISGTFPRIFFANSGDKDKIKSIDQWGTIAWDDMSEAFYGCSNLEYFAADTPDLSNVISLYRMFRQANSFNGNLNDWDVSNVTNFSGAFELMATYNQPLDNWDVSNGDNFNGMFFGSSAFDQSLGDWDISSVTDMTAMLQGSGLSFTNYDATLQGWATLDAGESQIPTGVNLDAYGLNFCNAETEKDGLINTFGWTINDDGKFCNLPFITKWLTTSNNETIVIPTFPGESYNYDIDWGDGTVETVTTDASPSHTYAGAGEYTISIFGQFPRIYFNFGAEGQQVDKIISVEQWGDIPWSAMELAFSGCSNLVVNATDTPDLSSVFSTGSMFNGCTSFNTDINNWDVSNVLFFGGMFENATSFNQPLDSWVMNQAIILGNMFSGATSFNQPLDSWNTDNTSTMQYMFDRASSFNQDLNSWNVSNVTTMIGMFGQASAFNGDISNWDVHNVEDMQLMFSSATAFNQDIGGWNVENVTTMYQMFIFASSFNQDISNWNVGAVTNMEGMFLGASQFNSPLNNWNVSNVTNMRALFIGFNGESSFNQPLNNWDVSQVTDMANMFGGVALFDQPLDSWNVSNVSTMDGMFSNASSFNQSLSSWNVSNVNTMAGMFQGASSFNQEISGWDVSQVTDFSRMFTNATSFNQSLGDWDISNVSDMTNLFNSSAMSTANYDATLIGWASLDDGESQVPSGISLGAVGLTYCGSETARDLLLDGESGFGWDISGDIKFCTGFITKWETTAANESITIPTEGPNYNYDIDWGDGQTDTGITGNFTHTYELAGEYTVTITGAFPRIYFAGSTDENRTKFKSIEQWGSNPWTSMEGAFQQCLGFTFNATDVPNLLNVVSMRDMFNGCTNFNSDMNGWDVSNVENMAFLFLSARSFNQPLDNWNVSNVTSMAYAFEGTYAFNQNISNWDVSNVDNMLGTFSSARLFNQDISNWNVSAVTNMSQMFNDAQVFDYSLGNWDISSVTDMANMLDDSGLSTTNYDNTLIGWATLDPGESQIPNGITLGANGLTYCHASFEHQSLQFGPTPDWTIVGDSEVCSSFITTWKTDNPGTSSDTQITIPVNSGMSYSYDVFWEEVGNPAINGSVLGITSDITIDFPSAGTYQVSISGEFPQISFNNVGDKEKILTIEQWGNIEWASMESAFYGCSNLTIPATDAPNLGNVLSMGNMFRNASALNQPIGHWNVSSVTSMFATFSGASSFNQPLNNWNVGNVTFMSQMFDGASSFNQPLDTWNVANVSYFSFLFNNAFSFNQDLNSWNLASAVDLTAMFQYASSFNGKITEWNTSNVTNLSSVFAGASAFNQPIGSWDVSNVTNMYSLFAEATSFNQDISNWNVANVTDMSLMFYHSSVFNQNIGNWDVGSVINMEGMFYQAFEFNQPIGFWDVSNVQKMGRDGFSDFGMLTDATSFDQSLEAWDISSVTDMTAMLSGSGMSITNYDATLSGWAAQPTVPSGINFGADGLNYCNASSVRQDLIDTYEWIITGDTENCTEACDPAVDRNALTALYNATDGANWNDNTNWLTAAPLDTWYGVTTNASGCVIGLDLGSIYEVSVGGFITPSNNLSGTLPAEIGDLSGLEILNLNNNQLSGSLPAEIGNLQSLQILDLGFNQLSGSIPSEIGGLNNLLGLYMAQNQLSGSIPSEIGNLTTLKELVINVNQFTGEIPSEIGNLTELTALLLGENQLTGSIPSELGNLDKVTFLELKVNNLTGSIPPELGNLVSVHNLNLEDNQLSGSIPPELGQLSNLLHLNLPVNQLTGSIPPELGNLSNLIALDLGTNQLSGNLPVELANLQNLEELLFYGNELTGSIPPEYGSFPKLRKMLLAGSNLTGDIPPELAQISTLEELIIGGNQLTGEIPEVLFTLTNLKNLHLGNDGSGFTDSGNLLTGTLSPNIQNLANLEVLILRGNAGLTGKLPNEIISLTNFWQLDYSETNLCEPNTAEFESFIQDIINGGGPVVGRTDICSPLYWEGTVSSDWSEPLNWSTGEVPTFEDDVLIDPTVFAYPNAPVIADNGGQIPIDGGSPTPGDGGSSFGNEAQNLVINNGGELFIESGFFYVAQNLFVGEEGDANTQSNLTIGDDQCTSCLSPNIRIEGSWITGDFGVIDNPDGEIIFTGQTLDATIDLFSTKNYALNNVTIETDYTINFESDLTVHNNLDLYGGDSGDGTLNINGYTIRVGGDWDDSGTNFNWGNGKVEFNGGEVIQNIYSFPLNGFAFFNLEVNQSSDINGNPPAGVEVQDDIEIENELMLTKGVLITNTNGNLILNENAFYSGGSNTSYIEGTAYKLFASGGTPFEFPVGNDGKFAPITIETSGLGEVSTGYIAQALSTLEVDGDIDRVTKLESWGIFNVDPINPIDIFATLQWDENLRQSNIADLPNLRVVLLVEGDGGIAWEDAGPAAGGGLGDVVTGLVTSSTIPIAANDFEQITFGNFTGGANTFTPPPTTYYSVNGGGDWEDLTTWSTSSTTIATPTSLPTEFDNVVVQQGHTVSFSAPAIVQINDLENNGTIDFGSNLADIEIYGNTVQNGTTSGDGQYVYLATQENIDNGEFTEHNLSGFGSYGKIEVASDVQILVLSNINISNDVYFDINSEIETGPDPGLGLNTASNITFNGSAWNDNGNGTYGDGNVVFNNSSVISSSNPFVFFDNLEIDSNGEVDLLADLEIGDNISIINGGYLFTDTYIMNSSSAANFELGVNSTLETASLLSPSTPTGFGNYMYDPTSTLVLSGSSTQIVDDNETYGNVVITNPDEVIMLESGPYFSVSGNLSIESIGTLDLGTVDVQIAGNFSLGDGTLTTSSNFIFNGSQSQSISSNSPFTFYQLEVNKPAADLFINVDVNVSQDLTMVSGDIYVSTNQVLNISNPSPASIIYSSGTVFGKLARDVLSASSYPYYIGNTEVTLTPDNSGGLLAEFLDISPDDTGFPVVDATGPTTLEFTHPEGYWIVESSFAGNINVDISAPNFSNIRGDTRILSRITGPWTASATHVAALPNIGRSTLAINGPLELAIGMTDTPPYSANTVSLSAESKLRACDFNNLRFVPSNLISENYQEVRWFTDAGLTIPADITLVADGYKFNSYPGAIFGSVYGQVYDYGFAENSGAALQVDYSLTSTGSQATLATNESILTVCQGENVKLVLEGAETQNGNTEFFEVYSEPSLLEESLIAITDTRELEFSFEEAGNPTVYVVIRDEDGCISTGTTLEVNFTIFAIPSTPVSFITSPTGGETLEVCEGQPLVLTLENNLGTNQQFEIFDNVTNGILEGTPILTSTSTEITLLEESVLDQTGVEKRGIYYVRTRNTESDCTSEEFITVEYVIRPKPAILQTENIVNLSYCFGEPTILPVGSLRTPSQESYQWYVLNDGTEEIINVPRNENNQFQISGTLQPDNYTYFVRAINDVLGCQTDEFVTFQVTVNPIPTVPTINFAASELLVCQDEAIKIVLDGSLESGEIYNFYTQNLRGSQLSSSGIQNTFELSPEAFQAGQQVSQGVYYVEKFNELTNCFSNLIAVPYQVLAKPEQPIITNTEIKACINDSFVMGFETALPSNETYVLIEDGQEIGRTSESSFTYTPLVGKVSGQIEVSIEREYNLAGVIKTCSSFPTSISYEVIQRPDVVSVTAKPATCETGGMLEVSLTLPTDTQGNPLIRSYNLTLTSNGTTTEVVRTPNAQGLITLEDVTVGAYQLLIAQVGNTNSQGQLCNAPQTFEFTVEAPVEPTLNLANLKSEWDCDVAQTSNNAAKISGIVVNAPNQEALTYSWVRAGTTIEVANTLDVANLPSGSYKLIVTDTETKCTVETENITVEAIKCEIVVDNAEKEILKLILEALKDQGVDLGWDLDGPPEDINGVKFNFDGKVTSLDLSSLSIEKLPTQLILQLEDLARFNVSNNRLTFGDLEPFANIAELIAGNQAPVDEELEEVENITQTVTLTVTSTGANDQIQWFKDGIPIEGANGSELVIDNLSLGDAGTYTAVVTNPLIPGLSIERKNIDITVTEKMRETDKKLVVNIFEKLGIQPNGGNGNRTSQEYDPNAPAASWPGVTQELDRCVGLDFSSFNLDGVIPEEIGQLTELRRLSLFDNQLSGGIPESIGNLTQLTYLDLDKNNLSGPVPESIGQITTLKTVWLSRNAFTSLPQNMGNLTNLEYFLIHENQFESIPASMQSMPHLRVFDLRKNNLTSFFAQTPNYPQLERLILANNQIESIDFSTSSLPNLRELDLSDNLLKDLPTGITSSNSLERVWVRRNFLEFDDLEPLHLEILEYTPQSKQLGDESILVTVGDPINLDPNIAGSQNAYQWFKDGQRITLTPSPNANYSISALANSDAGVYECRVTSALVPDLVLTTRTITVNTDCGDLIDAVITTQSKINFCEGDNVFTTLKVTSAEGFSYTWKRNGQALTLATDSIYNAFEAGTYTVEITGPLGCVSESKIPIEITITEVPEISITLGQDNLFEANTTADPSTIYWIQDGRRVDGASGTSYPATESGLYQAAIEVSSGCIVTSEPLLLSVTALDTKFTTGPLIVYPNPTQGGLSILFPALQKEVTIMVSDVHGKQISLKKYQRVDNVQLNMNGLPKGLYLLEMSSEQGHVIRKVTKE